MNEDQPTKTTAAAAGSAVKPLGDVIAINEGLIKDHLGKMVVKTVGPKKGQKGGQVSPFVLGFMGNREH